jgi:hypothetical protein
MEVIAEELEATIPIAVELAASIPIAVLLETILCIMLYDATTLFIAVVLAATAFIAVGLAITSDTLEKLLYDWSVPANIKMRKAWSLLFMMLDAVLLLRTIRMASALAATALMATALKATAFAAEYLVFDANNDLMAVGLATIAFINVWFAAIASTAEVSSVIFSNAAKLLASDRNVSKLPTLRSVDTAFVLSGLKLLTLSKARTNAPDIINSFSAAVEKSLANNFACVLAK